MRMQRCLSPTAAPVSFMDLGRAILGLFQPQRYRQRLEAELKRYFDVEHVFLLSSGRAALATIVEAFAATSPRRKVIIPAYTCFSVPSAIVRAGGQVVLCDIDPHTLDFDFEQLQGIVDSETLCIVSPHLLGQIADIRRTKAIAEPFGILVIEDAAQAIGRKTAEGWVGTMGDVGFFSLGRGKNVTAGSGGVIVTNSNDLADRLAKSYAKIREESLLHQIVNGVMVCAMTVFIHPRAYWLPAGLSFLGLGETIYDPTFSIRRLDGLRAGLLKTWQRRLEDSNKDRARHTDLYLSSFCPEEAGLDPGRMHGTAYLRLPLLMPTRAEKQELCSAGKDLGLGVTALYPAPVSEIPELKSRFQGQQYPGADTLSDRLITLPVHHYVNERDIARICGVLHEIVAGAHPSVAAHHSRVTDRMPSPAETREAGVTNMGQ
jgi:dTDP-4-amino-4,6-dideoxygalactose transaminase